VIGPLIIHEYVIGQCPHNIVAAVTVHVGQFDGIRRCLLQLHRKGGIQPAAAFCRKNQKNPVAPEDTATMSSFPSAFASPTANVPTDANCRGNRICVRHGAQRAVVQLPDHRQLQIAALEHQVVPPVIVHVRRPDTPRDPDKRLLVKEFLIQGPVVLLVENGDVALRGGPREPGTAMSFLPSESRSAMQGSPTSVDETTSSRGAPSVPLAGF